MARHFSLDSIAVRDRRVFGWGWCLDTEAPLSACELEVPLADGRRWVVRGVVQGRRPDVAAAFPDVHHAAAAAFSLRGIAPAPVAEGSATFRARYADGGTHEVVLDHFPSRFQPRQASLAVRSRAVLAAARDEGWGAAVRRLGTAVRNRVAALRLLAMHPWWSWRIPLRGAVVVFDHAMGGGANRYRLEREAAHIAAGRTVVVVTPRLSTLDFLVSVRARHGEWRMVEHDLEAVLARLAVARPSRVEVNEAVTFPDVGRVLRWSLAQQRRGAHLRFNLHDFHAVCPSYTLMDAEDRFCGIPGLAACRRCLPANPLHTLGFDQHVSMLHWRSDWAAFLQEADEVVAFSASSEALLRRAFPALPEDRVRIEPHAPPAPALRAVRKAGARGDGDFVIAAVGHLSVAKGAAMVNALAHGAHARGLPLRFVVAGTTDRPDPGVATTGAFERERLPDLLERLGADACLLPSLIPETYSYLADELMQTGLPLAVFDVGAPPERVRRYPGGLVLPIEPGEALDAIMRDWVADSRRAAGMEHS